jgi:hypothetical protein
VQLLVHTQKNFLGQICRILLVSTETPTPGQDLRIETAKEDLSTTFGLGLGSFADDPNQFFVCSLL